MQQAFHEIHLPTHGKGLYDITPHLRAWVQKSEIRQGLLTLFIRHTSASLLIQENADPGVQSDLENFLSRLVPESEQLYAHRDEGADDMPAHIRAALTQTHLSIPVMESRPGLGTWQGVYVFEHRRAPQSRSVLFHLLGE